MRKESDAEFASLGMEISLCKVSMRNLAERIVLHVSDEEVANIRDSDRLVLLDRFVGCEVHGRNVDNLRYQDRTEMQTPRAIISSDEMSGYSYHGHALNSTVN